MSTKFLWELVTGIIIIAIVYMLVRPGSPAGTAITDLSNALIMLVTTATGYQQSGGAQTA